MKSTTKTLIEAMQILANEIHSEDGIANAAIFEASERLSEQQKRIKYLEQELQKSTDQNDLILDEFIRVKCLTRNTEIHQLCERAHIRMRQNVPVIERNHRMQKRIAELGQELESARFFQVDVIRCLNKIAWEHNHSEIPQYMSLARGCILKIEAQQAKQLNGRN